MGLSLNIQRNKVCGLKNVAFHRPNRKGSHLGHKDINTTHIDIQKEVIPIVDHESNLTLFVHIMFIDENLCRDHLTFP